MYKQTSIFEAIAEGEMKIHDRENNPGSEAFLKENRGRLTRQCERVLAILKSGKRLTTLSAAMQGILSLPRRILDIKGNGIEIKERWVIGEDGKRKIKEWYL